MILKDKLRKCLDAKGMDAAKLAELIGCRPNTVWQWMNKNTEPGFRFGVQAAMVLGVSPDWLADDAADWPPPAATVEDKILASVRKALIPYDPEGDRHPDENEVLTYMRDNVHYDARGPILDVIRIMVDFHKNTFEFGQLIGKECQIALAEDESLPDVDAAQDRFEQQTTELHREIGHRDTPQDKEKRQTG